MSGDLVLVESDSMRLRAALIRDRRLAALEIDRVDRPPLMGAIMPARVIRTVRGLGPLVKLPDGTEMLLDRDHPPVTAGESITIQAVREPRGAKLGLGSRSITLTGRALIHLPLEGGISVSRRAAISENRRAALQSLLTGRRGGWIVRRTATLVDDVAIAAEADALAREAKGLLDDTSLSLAPDAFRRLMSDHGLPAPDGIIVCGRAAEQSVERWRSAFAVDHSVKIERHTGLGGLFDAHDLEEAIESLSNPRVPLADGGAVVIEGTEALTAVDVNAGADSNALGVNLAAAKEIARQLILRHIGGIVVIDFISLSRPSDRERTVAALKSAVADDAARTRILPMSAFGLVEMTRERRGPKLELDG